MSDEKRLIIALILMIMVPIVWYKIFPPPEVSKNLPEEAEMESERKDEVKVDSRKVEESVREIEEDKVENFEPLEGKKERLVEIKNGKVRFIFSNRGAVLNSALVEYNNEDKVELVIKRSDLWPFALIEGTAPSYLNEKLYAVFKKENSVNFVYREPKLSVEKTFRVTREGFLEIEVKVVGMEGWSLFVGPDVEGVSKGISYKGGVIFLVNNELERVSDSKAKEDLKISNSVKWVALHGRYFIKIFVPLSVSSIIAKPVTVKNEKLILSRVDEGYNTQSLIFYPSEGTVKLKSYYGEKSYTALSSFPDQYNFSRALEWGFFGFIAKWLLIAILGIYKYIPNYGWSIVIVTFLLRFALLPLTIYSYSSMKKMQKIQPKVQKIKDRYRGKLRDKRGRIDFEMQRKMNEEIQELFKREKVSPMGGCLPVLIQIPIFFAFFRLLSTAAELRKAEWILWIKDLSSPDPLYILPIAMGVTQYIQQQMTPPTDPLQKRLFTFFPVVFTVISFSFPSGLVLYWVASNVFTLGQSYIYDKLFREK